MKANSSRRNFLAAGLALPAAGIGPVPAQLQPVQSSSKTPELRYRTLGKTGLRVTSVGFGCMITADPSVIERAADIGINYFDTARGYQSGNNERMVGAALKSRRKNLYLSSKTHGGSRDECLRDLETSLRELATDYLDIWYLHAKSKASEVRDDLMEAQTVAKQQGKIRFSGISTHSGQKDLIPAVLGSKHFDVVLTSYNFTMEPEFAGILKTIKTAGLGIVAMKVMAGGYRRVKPTDKHYSTLKREGAMLAALKWALRNSDVDTTVPSMTDMDQLDENLTAMTAGFTPQDDRILMAQLEQIGGQYCRMCGACTGACPRGLPVSDMLRYLTYVEGYGQFSLGRDNFRALPAELQAVRCADCSQCAVRCRNGIQIASRLIQAQELFA